MRKNIRFKTLREILFEKAEKTNTRVCEADGEHAFFHRWIDDDRIVIKYDCFIRTADAEEKARRSLETGLYGPGQDLMIVTQTFALVELMDGSVKKVVPTAVRFWEREEAE